MSLPLLLLLATLGLGVLFALTYQVARRLDNYGIVDIVWSYAFGGLAIFYACTAGGWWPRRVLFAALIMAWSLRLGTHLFIRVRAHHPVEDGRYAAMRTRWAAGFARQMFIFFQQQALSVVILGLPFLLSMRHTAPGLHPLEWAAAGLWLLALSGESLADAQLEAFKRDPSRRGQVCAVGLWRYSRHPNYFCEWLIWVSFALFAAAAPWGWLGVLSPAVILFLLLRVTGIPLTEEQSVRSRGDAYRQYQRTTSAFFPWFPRRA